MIRFHGNVSNNFKVAKFEIGTCQANDLFQKHNFSGNMISGADTVEWNGEVDRKI